MIDGTQLLDRLGEQGVTVWGEGTRLRFRAAKGRLTEALREQLTSNKEAILSAWRVRAAREVVSHPASQGQRSLWFLHESSPRSVAYNVLFSLRLRSVLDPAAFRHACQALVDRHPSLRTTFGTEGGELVQRVHGHATVDLTQHDRPGADPDDLRREVIARSRVPFDLQTGPVLRIDLYSRAPDDHILLITMHHIAADGWSMFLLLDELRVLYPAECDGGANPPARPASDVVAFARWQSDLVASPAGQAHEKYWRSALAGEIPVLDLPLDHPRPPFFGEGGSSVPLDLGAAATAGVRALAAAHATTPYVVLLAAYQVLLHRYSGQGVIIVGSPTYGRDRPEFADVIGDFINMIPLKGDLRGDPAFSDFLNALRRSTVEGIEHQDYPFPLLVERLQPRRDPSRTPIFQSIFTLQKFSQLAGLERALTGTAGGGKENFGTLTIEAFPIPQQEGQVDIALEIVEFAGSYRGELKFKPELFEAGTIAAMGRHLKTLLLAAIAAPETKVSQLPLLDPAERAALVSGFNLQERPATASRIPPDGGATLHAQFEAEADRRANAIAVTCEGQSLTYRQLNERANRLAHRLAALDVGPDVLVGICMERSNDLVAGLLGILKAGGAYLPIDLAYPADRLAFMLEDARAPVLLTQTHLISRLPATVAKVIAVDELFRDDGAGASENPVSGTGPDHLAYVIYTSGTTGKPKGSEITHRNVARLFSATEHWFGFNEDDVWTLFHSYAFDFSVWELWGALLYGGRLVVVPFMVSRSPTAFYEMLANEHVTVLNQTPSAFRQLMLAEDMVGQKALDLRYVIFGGEALEMPTLGPWFKRHGDRRPRLVNMYGITETTVHVTYRPIGAADLARGSVIGVPIPDLQIYILDSHREPVPVGVAGEMYVGGAGLARGYLHRPELSAERFIPDHLTGDPKGRLYKTGDLARFLPGRDIEYLGRIDHQVKIRGFRIELGEIESILSQHGQVRESVVRAISDKTGEKRLVAYVVADAPVPAVSELRDHLAKKVPDYMIPAAFVFLERLPLTNNGKVDRAALPSPDTATTMVGEEFTEPETETERAVAKVFAEVLNVPAVGARHNFFELGGHSLLATRALGLLRARFEIEIPVHAFFQAPTVRGLGQWLDARIERKNSPVPSLAAPIEEPARWKCLVPARTTGSRPPLFVVAGFMDPDDCMRIMSNLIPHLGADQPFCGLRPRWLDGTSPSYQSVAEIIADFVADIRAFQPKGPYYVVGDCVQGVVAVEIAQALLKQGEEVALLALLDSDRPRPLSFFLSEMDRIRGRGKHMLQLLGQFIKPTQGRRRQIIAEVFQRKLRRAGLGKQPITAIDDIYQKRVAYAVQLRHHRLKRYTGRITLILTDSVRRFVGLLGWSGFAEGGLEIYRTPGNHETFRGQYSRELGHRLRLCIDQAKSSIEQRAGGGTNGTSPAADRTSGG